MGEAFWPQSSEGNGQSSKLSVYALVALIFYDVSGGPFGIEDSVKAGGPLLALLGFLIFPFIWSVPEALITAELATAFPDNGGYVTWISAAFGPFWGFQQGFWKWLSGVIDNALYPVLFLDYLKYSFPVFSTGPLRIAALSVITFVLTYLNYCGLTVVGYTAIILGIFSLIPFLVLGILAIPKTKPSRWFVVDMKNVDWTKYLNTLFWNLNFWDKASTLAGEVEKPKENFPKALLYAVLLVIISYFIPLLAGTGAMELVRGDWEDGYFSNVGLVIGGLWLKWWIQVAAAISNIGLFEAEMSGDAFQLHGMGEMGMLPHFIARRSSYGTPTWAILFSATGVLLLSWMNFQEIIEFVNFLYSLGMLMEYAAFIWLRIKMPELPRPYSVPLKTFGIMIMCTPPSLLLIAVMCIASLKTIAVSALVVVIGVLLYPGIQYVKENNWLEFVADGRSTILDDQRQEIAEEDNCKSTLLHIEDA